jgi:crossover junction endodeoxyribonuclease RuvC
MQKKPSLLAIDPGLREMGISHFIGKDLVDFGVKSLRRPNNYKQRVNFFSLVIDRLLNEKEPDILVLEKNVFSKIQQNLPLVIAIKSLHKLAANHKTPVCEIAPNTVKKAVTGDGWATKRQVANSLCVLYPELKAYRESNRRWRIRYFMNMFDAVACARAYIILHKDTYDNP